MTRIALAFAALALLAAAGERAAPHVPIAEGERVRGEGARLFVGERPFHFVGANVAVMHGAERRGALAETLDAVVDDGLGVVRVWAFGEARENDGAAWRRDYAFRLGPDEWVPESFALLDRVLVEARARHLRVILVLANRWGDYGGFSQLARWAGHPPEHTHLSPGELDAFYRCAPCEALYQAHLRRVVGRVNAASGVPYAADATVLAFELANEISAASAAGSEAMHAWVERQALLVKALAPDALVSAGHIGYRTLRERAQWRRVAAIPAIDYADSHAYPADDPRIRGLGAMRSWIDDRAQLAQHGLGKPLVWGEVGFAAGANSLRGRPRDRWMDAFLRQVCRDGSAGALVWIYAHGAPAEPGSHIIATERAGHARSTRAVLQRWARRNAAAPPVRRNPRLDPAAGPGPLFVPRSTVRGTPAGVRWRELEPASLQACLAHDGFRSAQAEDVGVAAPDGGRPHLYAAGQGRVDFVLRWPELSAAPSRLVLRARLSSEVPGRRAGPDEGARVRVAWGGVELGVLEAPPDDGDGAWRTLEVSDPGVLRRLQRLAPRQLRFTLDAAVGAGGLCLYQPDAGEAGGAVEVRLEGISGSMRP
ncbi:MAG: hypothetical protein AAF447_07910 [Myxococcota bacterium]